MDTNNAGADIAGAIAKLKEHPEIISAVASALSGESKSESQSVTKTDFPIEKLSEVMSTLGPILSATSTSKEDSGSREDHRYALLCALRPYLSSDRREMIDYVLKFGKIGDLLKKIK